MKKLIYVSFLAIFAFFNTISLAENSSHSTINLNINNNTSFNVKVSYQNQSSIRFSKKLPSTLKPNRHYSTTFTFNPSGIQFQIFFDIIDRKLQLDDTLIWSALKQKDIKKITLDVTDITGSLCKNAAPGVSCSLSKNALPTQGGNITLTLSKNK